MVQPEVHAPRTHLDAVRDALSDTIHRVLQDTPGLPAGCVSLRVRAHDARDHAVDGADLDAVL